MKKFIIILLLVILCLTFTGCGISKANQILEMVQIEVDEKKFDISQQPQLIEAMQDENAVVSFSKSAWNPQQFVLSVRYPQTQTAYYSVDLENLDITPAETQKPAVQHAVLSSFDYKGKSYYFTMDAELTPDSGCTYLECEGEVTVLTDDGLSRFSASQFYCENGYVIMVKDTDKANVMHYMVYSVDQNKFIIDEDISYTDRRSQARYDVLNWLDGDRYMHFDTIAGQIIDVTEDFHAVDDNIINGNTPVEKMLDYRYVWNEVFYTITEEEGIVLYTKNVRSSNVNYIDREDYAYYSVPHLGDDGETLGITKAILKEDRR